jgi:predicted phosphodiesterase
LRKRYWSALFILLAAPCVYFAYAAVTYENLDLSALEKRAEELHLDSLIDAIQSEDVASSGFRFVVLGDTRSNFGRARNILARAAEEQPRFILHNGDLVRKGRVEEYTGHHLRLVDQVAPIPILPVAGNHEKGPNRDYEPFLTLYGREQFTFDYGGCRFVGINNSTKWGLTNTHLRFIRSSLEKPGAKHKFLLFHVPIRSLDIYVDGEEGRGFRRNAKALMTMMEEFSVDHVFMGHVHGYATTEVNDVRYSISGGGGANLSEKLDADGSVHNFLVIDVTPEGLKNTVYKLRGESWEATTM